MIWLLSFVLCGTYGLWAVRYAGRTDVKKRGGTVYLLVLGFATLLYYLVTVGKVLQ